MITPDQIPDHPGPQGYANDTAAIKSRGFPWFRVLLFLCVIVFFLFSLRSCGSTSDSTPQVSAAPVIPFYSNKRQGKSDDFERPVLVYVLGDEAVFRYRGSFYTVKGGSGPVGGDFFCSVLDGSSAVVHDGSGAQFRVGIDRTFAPDLRRDARRSSRGASDDVGAFD
jgi:hypothetical protein